MATLAARLRAESLRQRVNLLKTQQVIPQGTEEWLRARRLLLTASDIASFLTHSREHGAHFYAEEFGLTEEEFPFTRRCASPYGSGKSVIKRKHGIVAPMSDNIYTAWGHMHEPVIRSFWQVLHGGKEVLEFGLLTSRDPAATFLGASPDGICPEMGVVLEFKSPYSRNICVAKPRIPYHYWTQCRGSPFRTDAWTRSDLIASSEALMFCTDLPECHYMECAFVHYDREEDYLAYELDEEESKGCLVRFDTRSIDVPPISMWDDAAGQLAWARERAGNGGGTVVMWRMVAYNLIRTMRNRQYMDTILPTLRKAYHDLLHFDHAQAQKEDEEARARKKPRTVTPRAVATPLPARQDLCGDENDEAPSAAPVDMCGDDDDDADSAAEDKPAGPTGGPLDLCGDD